MSLSLRAIPYTHLTPRNGEIVGAVCDRVFGRLDNFLLRACSVPRRLRWLSAEHPNCHSEKKMRGHRPRLQTSSIRAELSVYMGQPFGRGWRGAPGEGQSAETFRPARPRPALSLRLRPVGLALRGASFSQKEKDTPSGFSLILDK